MTISVPLTKGLVALVDDEDAWVLDYRWYALCQPRRDGTERCYAARDDATQRGTHGRTRKQVLLHRAILNAPKERQIDHENRNTLDCQRANLRFATPTQNQCNSPIRPHRKKHSIYRGVEPVKRSAKWMARITVHHIRHNLGYYDTEEEAAAAYDRGACHYHGPFAQLNFPENDY